MSISNSEFEKLLRTCTEISILFPDGIVFIGGIAVYLHTINEESLISYAELTHDADFYISLADMSDLRDIEEVTANRRLSKHQIIKNGFEFDIYTERYSSLLVPYDQVRAYSKKIETINIACLEHLIVLKLEALRDRIRSAKGSKDIKDILRITQISAAGKKKLNVELIEAYLNEKHLKILRDISSGPEVLSLAKGNSKLAKEIRATFNNEFKALL